MFRAHTPETCRTKETSINCIVASSWHFTLFHDEDARSNNPQISLHDVHILDHRKKRSGKHMTAGCRNVFWNIQPQVANQSVILFVAYFFLKEITIYIVNLLYSNILYFAIFGVLKALFVKNQVLCSVRPYQTANRDDYSQIQIHRPRKVADLKFLCFFSYFYKL